MSVDEIVEFAEQAYGWFIRCLTTTKVTPEDREAAERWFNSTIDELVEDLY